VGWLCFFVSQEVFEMYSVVLMMALTSGAETPAFFKRGCSGCSGSSCAGASCGGGGGCSGRRGLFSGLCGGGHKRSRGCHGCSGGSGYSCCGAAVSCGGGYGCAGSGSCGGVAPAPAPMPAKPPVKKPEPVKKPPEEKEETLAPTAPATILVSLPADAKLFVDDAATTSTTASRTFVTPALENGKTYGYTLKAEVVRDGKVVSTAKQIEVRAGATSTVTLELPAETVASK
jgi:uncharacterized protein (TIGR03000 family)